MAVMYMQIGKAFRLKQSQAALQGCRIKKQMKNRGNDFSSPGASYQDTIQRTAQFSISNIKYSDNRKKVRIVLLIKTCIHHPPPECSLISETADLTLPSGVTSC